MSENTKLNLKSPTGKILAKDLNDLTNLIRSTSTKKTDDISIQNIKYFESEQFSMGVVDYLANGEFKSLLKVIELDEDYVILSDKHTVQLVKNSPRTSGSKDKSVIYSESALQEDEDEGYRCQGRDCCSWTMTGENRFNCGCADPTSLILTTSDGCEIEAL